MRAILLLFSLLFLASGKVSELSRKQLAKNKNHLHRKYGYGLKALYNPDTNKIDLDYYHRARQQRLQ